ncbi:Mu-like prophage major head subunit gpT family protein [Ktedonospora formicarum]|uniref:Bacteriophage Mu GpT domain-containing protein n=1 Tax=Ktedonospora formicarum TaxID=2778364 RepID=A0A8J3I5X1_9CHLR|nr:Mu-like prophage major head subunit gpT family protein [Ktedonospora formicarum]GHO47986.1 hypothetical protein KSX_61490 [Ktedonospora formicarum]
MSHPARDPREGQHITITDARIVERLSDSQESGHAVRVTVIQGGRSKNGYVYDDAALQSIAALLEGAHAYADHSREEADIRPRSVRDVVGFYHDTAFHAGADGEPGRVDATLHIFEAAGWLWSIMSEVCQLERPELIGLSVDLLGSWQVNESTNSREITAIHALNSCDVVTRPSAGGGIRHILHHDSTSTMPNGGSSPMAEQQSNDELSQLRLPHLEQESSRAHHTFEPSQKPISLKEQRRQLERMRQDIQLQQCDLELERRLQESILPEPIKAQVRGRFKGRLFEESELELELTSALDLMAQLTRDGLVRGHGYEKIQVSGMVSEAQKVQAAFDAMLGLEVDATRFGNIRPFSGIREAYGRVTGDNHLRGGISAQSQLGLLPSGPFAPTGYVSEADLSTANFAFLLGSSMNKRLLKDYQAWPADWQKFVMVTSIKDFKQQSRVRMGAFGNLAIVPEDTPYQALSTGDSAAVYVAQKRGNLVPITREAIINDDLQAIRQIPAKLAIASAYTLAEFVYGFLSGNPVIYDGVNLFAAGHNNLAASAPLSTATLQSGVTAMREQSNSAGKRLGLRPRFLIVPPELEWLAMIQTRSANIPGSNNNDINPMLGYVQPIISPQLSNTGQWFLAADPREVDTIEIGFVGGQVNPALFIQDQPTSGQNFTQDVITYKIRHEYGGAVVDYRGLYRGN